ncbi:hypothetical protein L0F63_000023, partial [Massospora cicadina]
ERLKFVEEMIYEVRNAHDISVLQDHKECLASVEPLIATDKLVDGDILDLLGHWDFLVLVLTQEF